MTITGLARRSWRPRSDLESDEIKRWDDRNHARNAAPTWVIRIIPFQGSRGALAADSPMKLRSPGGWLAMSLGLK